MQVSIAESSWPLDVAGCPQLETPRPILVSIASKPSLRFVFWALPLAAHASLVLPSWVLRLGVCPEDLAEVVELQSETHSVYCIEGPIASPLMASLVFCHGDILEAIRRQVDRGPRYQVVDMPSFLAVRLMGEVYIFKVLRTGPDEHRRLSIRHTPFGATKDDLSCVDGATAECVALLQKSPLVLCESGPPGYHLASFFQTLQQRWSATTGGELVFLPLVELLWETLVRKGLPQTLGKQLRHFVEQMNLENATEPVLYLGSIDGPLPECSQLTSQLWPLQNLRGCRLLGTCSSKDQIHPALMELFRDSFTDDGRLPFLGLLPFKGESRGTERKVCEVIGRAKLKEELQTTVVHYFTSADIFHTMGVSWPPRSLLHGPPGSGKTQLLKWLEIQVEPYAEVMWLRPADIWSRYLGESEERLRKAFATIQKKHAALLLLEGLDEFVKPSAADSTGVHGRLAATLLTLLDGIDAGRSSMGLAICATSRRAAKELDARLTRPGRMDRWLQVTAPDEEERWELLQHFVSLEGGACDACSEGQKLQILQGTKHFQPQDLRTLIRGAGGGGGDFWEAVNASIRPQASTMFGALEEKTAVEDATSALAALALVTAVPEDDDL